jgi:hypothetical protein
VLLIGSISVALVFVHDAFLHYGMLHEWYQFGGEGAFVLQGAFEPRENALIAVPAKVCAYIGMLFTPLGIALRAVGPIQRHLTRRCS